MSEGVLVIALCVVALSQGEVALAPQFRDLCDLFVAFLDAIDAELREFYAFLVVLLVKVVPGQVQVHQGMRLVGGIGPDQHFEVLVAAALLQFQYGQGDECVCVVGLQCEHPFQGLVGKHLVPEAVVAEGQSQSHVGGHPRIDLHHLGVDPQGLGVLLVVVVDAGPAQEGQDIIRLRRNSVVKVVHRTLDLALREDQVAATHPVDLGVDVLAVRGPNKGAGLVQELLALRVVAAVEGHSEVQGGQAVQHRDLLVLAVGVQALDLLTGACAQNPLEGRELTQLVVLHRYLQPVGQRRQLGTEEVQHVLHLWQGADFYVPVRGRDYHIYIRTSQGDCWGIGMEENL